VQTADERVLPQGTAYITDVGMTGPHDSVIGMDRSAILQRFLTALPQRFETATENPRLNAVIVAADETTGRAVSIERVSLSTQQIETLVAAPAAVR
jgi:calcineurin-like phosphoesterase